MRFQRVDQPEQRHWGRRVCVLGGGCGVGVGVGGQETAWRPVVGLCGDFEQSRSHRGVMESFEQKLRTSPSKSSTGN